MAHTPVTDHKGLTIGHGGHVPEKVARFHQPADGYRTEHRHD